jgi:hypothetical protein
MAILQGLHDARQGLSAFAQALNALLLPGASPVQYAE